jgi:heme-degrading monooxygenase HmoA
MIARIWRGATATDRAQDYLAYLERTGLAEYRATPGNHGVQVLLRAEDGITRFTLISYWESMDAVRAFAGDDPEVAVFYPEDDDFLVERDPGVEHHEVVARPRD